MTDTASAPDAQVAPPAEAEDNSARNRLVIAILLISTFVVILNETIMSVALPRLMIALDATASGVQWLTTAFLLTMAVVIPVTGFLIQRTNTRPLFFLAMGLFSLGTLSAALAPSLNFLIAARVVQALGTAIMMPLLMTTVMTLVPPHRRGPVMGNISLVISVAPAIGPALSGIILNYLTWPWLFWLVLPISLTVLVIGGRLIQNVTTPRYARLDVFSVPLSALAFGGLVYGLSGFGGESGAGGNHTTAYISLGVGAVAMATFVLRQIALQKQDRPLLDLRTFKTRNFSVSIFMMGIAMMTLFGTIIILPIYMQNVIGLDTLKTGALLLPGGVVMGLLGPQVGKLYEKFGPRPLVIPGTILVSAVLWSLTLVGTETSWVAILIGHIAISIGLAFVFTPLFTTSLSSVRPELYSHGSATLGSIQQMAGAAGVALFIALMTATTGNLAINGLSEVEALAGGIRTAFFCGGLLSLLIVAAGFFVQRPPDFSENGPMGGH